MIFETHMEIVLYDTTSYNVIYTSKKFSEEGAGPIYRLEGPTTYWLHGITPQKVVRLMHALFILDLEYNQVKSRQWTDFVIREAL